MTYPNDIAPSELYRAARADRRNDLTERLCMAHMSCPGAGALTPNVIDTIRKLAKYIEETHENELAE